MAINGSISGNSPPPKPTAIDGVPLPIGMVNQSWLGAKTALLVLVVSGLYGCATPMTPESCKALDMSTQGLADGEDGEGHSKLNRLVQTCNGFGVALDKSRYEAGYRQGLDRYCTAANAERLGRHGYGYYGACTGHPNELFVESAYRRGRFLYQLQDKINQSADLRMQLGNSKLSHKDREWLWHRLQETERDIRWMQMSGELVN